MTSRYLSREDAPITPELWKILDDTAIQAAKSVLAGRRLLHIEGPYGLGMKAVPLSDSEVKPGFLTSPSLPVSLIFKSFTLGKRNLASYERDGIALDLGALAQAALDVARLEDALIFEGAAGVPGLLAVGGANAVQLSDWGSVGKAAEDIIEAVSALDSAGFHGPYGLGLAPSRHNLLFRLYPNGTISELEHLRTIVTDGVFKAPVLGDGGVVLATGRQFASIVLGQDLAVGFVGPVAEELEFSVSESLVLLIRQPQAICILKA